VIEPEPTDELSKSLLCIHLFNALKLIKLWNCQSICLSADGPKPEFPFQSPKSQLVNNTWEESDFSTGASSTEKMDDYNTLFPTNSYTLVVQILFSIKEMFMTDYDFLDFSQWLHKNCDVAPQNNYQFIRNYFILSADTIKFIFLKYFEIRKKENHTSKGNISFTVFIGNRCFYCRVLLG
jgi:hypothetical protein